MAFGASQQKLAVDSGVWPLYRFDPRRARQPAIRRCIWTTVRRGRAWPITCATSRDSAWSSAPIPTQFKQFLKEATEAAQRRYAVYQQLAGITVPSPKRRTKRSSRRRRAGNRRAPWI